MIEGPGKEIDVARLEALIQNGVAEGRTLEYKRELSVRRDDGKGTLLATVCAFANADGGDLVIGMDADKGVATGLPGMASLDMDRDKLQMEQVLRSGLDPRVSGVEIHEILLGDQKWVVVVRVPASWTAPHRVRETRKFYVRHSAGRHELDVGEIRTAFAMSETLVQRIEDFRAQRIGRILTGRTPVVLGRRGCMAVHIVPVGAFRTMTAIDIEVMESKGKFMSPLGNTGFHDWHPNLDGLVTLARDFSGDVQAYTQTFRTGAVEGVYVLPVRGEEMYVPSVSYESYVVRFLANYLKCAQDFEVGPPYYVFLSFVGATECRFHVSPMLAARDVRLREDVVSVPEVVIRDREGAPAKVLRPVFDMVWNAFGYVRSMNYDRDGRWSERSH